MCTLNKYDIFFKLSKSRMHETEMYALNPLNNNLGTKKSIYEDIVIPIFFGLNYISLCYWRLLRIYIVLMWGPAIKHSIF